MILTHNLKMYDVRISKYQSSQLKIHTFSNLFVSSIEDSDVLITPVSLAKAQNALLCLFEPIFMLFIFNKTTPYISNSHLTTLKTDAGFANVQI